MKRATRLLAPMLLIAMGSILLTATAAYAPTQDAVTVPGPHALLLLTVGAAALAWRLSKRR